MNALRWLDDYFEETLAVILFTAILIIGSEQVITRYIFRFVHSWAEELMRILFVALSIVSFVLCAKHRQHVSVGILAVIVPPFARKILALISSVTFLIFCLLVVWYSFDITMMQYRSGQVTAAMGIPTWTYFMWGPIFFLLLCFRIIQKEIMPVLRGEKS